jgi:hypothetical protein
MRWHCNIDGENREDRSSAKGLALQESNDWEMDHL